MYQQPRSALPHVLTSLMAIAALTLGAATLPSLSATAETAIGSSASERAGAKCSKLKTIKARRQCRRDLRSQATATIKPSAATAGPTSATSAKPTATASLPGPTVTPAAVASTGGPTSLGTGSGTLAALIALLGDYGVLAQQPATGVFSPSSEWNRDIAAAPIAADSAGLVANIASQVATRYGGIAAFNVNQYNVSVYTVGRRVPRADVIWDNCQNKSYIPSALYDLAKGGHFRDVPIPSNAVPAAGSDGELTVYSPATDQLWEFWQAKKQVDGWHACWGGRIDSVSTNRGYFGSGMGVGATGLTAVGGVISIADGQSLKINHALSLALPEVAHWSTFSYPAQRSDGNQPIGAISAVQEGRRFRLDPTLDISKLSLTPVARAIATAAQKYGFIVDNVAGAVSVSTESGAASAAASGTNPWTAILNGTPSYLVMRNFPWSKLQALPIDYGK